jgi:hypothetical protein
MPTAQPRRHAGHHQRGRQTASGTTSPRQAPATRTHRTSQAPQTPGQANRTVGHHGSRRRGGAGPRGGRLAARSAAADTQVSNVAGVACCARGIVRCGWRPLDGHQPRCTDQVTLCTEVDQICRKAASQERMLMCSPACLRCGLRQSPAAQISGLTSPLTISAKQLPTRSGEGLCRGCTQISPDRCG